MRWLAPLLLIGLVLISVPAYAQLGQPGPSGDFRVNDRPGAAPTVGAPGGPSVPPDPTLFRDFAGTKSPDEILKSLDNDLGKTPVGDSGVPSRESAPDSEKSLTPGTSTFLK